MAEPHTDVPRDDDDAFLAAWEARKAGGPAAAVPAQWRDEIEDLVRVQRRIAAEPLPQVPAAVRAVVLGAAVQQSAARPVDWWSRLGAWLLRPVPVLAVAGVLVLAVAVSLRPRGDNWRSGPSPPRAASRAPQGEAVALADRTAGPPAEDNGTATASPQPVAQPTAAPSPAKGPVSAQTADAAAAMGAAGAAAGNAATASGEPGGPRMPAQGDRPRLPGGGAQAAAERADSRAPALDAPAAQPPAARARLAVLQEAGQAPRERAAIAARPASVAPGSAALSPQEAEQAGLAKIAAAEAAPPAAMAPATASAKDDEGSGEAKRAVAKAEAAPKRAAATGGAAVADSAQSESAGRGPSLEQLRQQATGASGAARRTALERLAAAARRASDGAQLRWAEAELAKLKSPGTKQP